jgi:hypothetical protein
MTRATAKAVATQATKATLLTAIVETRQPDLPRLDPAAPNPAVTKKSPRTSYGHTTGGRTRETTPTPVGREIGKNRNPGKDETTAEAEAEAQDKADPWGEFEIPDFHAAHDPAAWRSWHRKFEENASLHDWCDIRKRYEIAAAMKGDARRAVMSVAISTPQPLEGMKRSDRFRQVTYAVVVAQYAACFTQFAATSRAMHPGFVTKYMANFLAAYQKGLGQRCPWCDHDGHHTFQCTLMKADYSFSYETKITTPEMTEPATCEVADTTAQQRRKRRTEQRNKKNKKQ